MDVEESHRCSRLGSGGERDAEDHVTRNLNRRKQRGPRMEKGSKDQEGSTSRTMGSRSCPSELLKNSYASARGRLQT